MSPKTDRLLKRSGKRGSVIVLDLRDLLRQIAEMILSSYVQPDLPSVPQGNGPQEVTQTRYERVLQEWAASVQVEECYEIVHQLLCHYSHHDAVKAVALNHLAAKDAGPLTQEIVCEHLGNAAVAQKEWDEAVYWYGKCLASYGKDENPKKRWRLFLGMGIALGHKGPSYKEAANDYVTMSRTECERQLDRTGLDHIYRQLLLLYQHAEEPLERYSKHQQRMRELTEDGPTEAH